MAPPMGRNDTLGHRRHHHRQDTSNAFAGASRPSHSPNTAQHSQTEAVAVHPVAALASCLLAPRRASCSPLAAAMWPPLHSACHCRTTAHHRAAANGASTQVARSRHPRHYGAASMPPAQAASHATKALPARPSTSHPGRSTPPPSGHPQSLLQQPQHAAAVGPSAEPPAVAEHVADLASLPWDEAAGAAALPARTARSGHGLAGSITRQPGSESPRVVADSGRRGTRA